ncbi:hypothetical protein KIJ96_09045 [Pseudoalteromonas piscicida]|uniref:hypothetical protein n=1 Tax=Pseudoalteromonas TaxID=53246 RepID=UPI00029B0017|nr:MULTISPECIES: hypothetical protein [Pseudoalteromonas]WMP13825.1 putative precursor peptide [Pseudoalteromonas flavipulchra]MCF2828729.1 hypothetical protein [Pseudoalteromonas sp. OF5H-5]MCF2830780.1 hypothetical protein [Pseudoalteromonas sp. DL2-H6]MCF2925099.1 hypothetical protein [Pseudoalteromonas sp. DL2-H1]QUI72638.1 hypothetical protein GSF13_24295 [Pseudoalteromonas sp. M8]
MKLKLNKKAMKSLNVNEKAIPLKMTPQVNGAGGHLYTHLRETDYGDSAKCGYICVIQLNPYG